MSLPDQNQRQYKLEISGKELDKLIHMIEVFQDTVYVRDPFFNKDGLSLISKILRLKLE